MAEVGGENTIFYGHQALLPSAASQGAVGTEVPEGEEKAQAGLTAPPRSGWHSYASKGLQSGAFSFLCD